MKVAVFGLAMKDYSSDDRVSPAHTVVDRLLELGADVYAYDPEVPRRADWHVQSADEAVKGADALFLLAVQRQFADLDWHDLISSMNPNPFILDTKHYLKSRLQQAPPHRYLGV